MEKMKFGPYEWRVLERKGNTALLITEGIIERDPYHSAAQITGSTIWATDKNETGGIRPAVWIKLG